MYDEELIDIERKAKRYNQEHLLEYYNKLSEGEKKEKFKMQLKNIDFELIENLYRKTAINNKKSAAEIEPINYWDKKRLGGKYDFYESIGAEAIKSGKLAAVTMAGGQGTRLGHNGPKGTFDMGLDSHKSLFELLCDSLKDASRKYNSSIPWFIMTSEENNDETIEFFEKNRYFGYEKNINFFVQGKMPMIDTEGKILIGEDGLIKEAADGHGGIFEALIKSNMLDKMRELGVEWVFIGGVDNCLVRMVDPVLMGLTIYRGAEVAGKSVLKNSPKENVGVFCKRDGKPSVVEYSEINPIMAEATDLSGELLFGESHILCNLFNIETIKRMACNPLPYHSAFKKAAYMDKDGNTVKPNSPNAYKFETFIFDAFESVDEEKMVVLRVEREKEFAPIKNATGVDSPETARELYNKLHVNKRDKEDEGR